MAARIGLVRYFLVFIVNMDSEQLSRNNEDKKETTHNNISVDYYENFLKKQVNIFEKLLKEECNTDTDERVLMAKIVSYQECYVQYLLLKGKNNMVTDKKEINNYLQIKNLLQFESDDDFYFLQIIRRKKENPSLGSNSKTIKTFYISNIEYLDSKIEEIKVLCRLYNARACINLNRRSYKKCAFQFLSKISNKLLNEDYVMHKTYDSICGTYNKEAEKKWVVDLDGEQIKEKDLIRDFLKTCEPLSENTEWNDKVIAEIPSKNGLHLITTPFNVQKFRLHFPYIDIHKDNPTNLFIP